MGNVVMIYSNGEWKELYEHEADRIVRVIKRGTKKPYVDCFTYAKPGFAYDLYHILSMYTPTKEIKIPFENAYNFMYQWLLYINGKYYVLTSYPSKSKVCVDLPEWFNLDEPVPVTIIVFRRIPKELVRAYM